MPPISRLVDHLGRPVDITSLEGEKATVTVAGVRPVSDFSTLSSLTPSSLAATLRAAAENDIQAYLTLAEEMEERDLHYASVLGTRKLAVEGLDVSVEAASDEAQDVRIAEAVRELTAADEFSNLIADLTDALGKGFSVCEIVWERSASEWRPVRYEHRDPRWFQFDLASRRELRLRDEKDIVNGLPLTPYCFIVHYPRLKTGIPIRGGLARLAAVAFLVKNVTIKDWAALAEVFGMPMRVGKYGPSATAEDIGKLVTAVVNLGIDAAAVIPESMVIEFQQAANLSGAGDFFEKLGQYLDKQVSKGVLGQTMTTDEGGSLSQSQTHDQVRKDIRDKDAKQMRGTLSAQLVRPFVDLNFGPQKRYPKLCIEKKEPEDLKSLSESLPPFIDRGLKIQASEIRDKFGLTEPEDGAELLEPQSGGGGFSPAGPAAPADGNPPPTAQATGRNAAGAPAGEDDSMDELAGADLGDWEPILDPVMEPVRLLVQDAKSLEDLKARLPEVLASMNSAELVERLAEAAFKARGQGDATDKV